MTHRILITGVGASRLHMFADACVKAGHTAETYEQLSQALPRLRQLQPTAILLVCRLDQPEGRQTFAALRLHQEVSSLPIVVVTPYIPPSVALAALASGAADILMAPLQAKRVEERLRLCLGEGPEDPRARIAVLQSGPAQLRRIDAFLRASDASGALRVTGEGIDAEIVYADGAPIRARLGAQQDAATLRAILALRGAHPWRFELQQAPATGDKPAPVNPAPANPAPANPVPANPAPASPAPANPAPASPAPASPAPASPAPASPAPASPAPANPAPVPAPASPAPANPAPVPAPAAPTSAHAASPADPMPVPGPLAQVPAPVPLSDARADAATRTPARPTTGADALDLMVPAVAARPAAPEDVPAADPTAEAEPFVIDLDDDFDLPHAERTGALAPLPAAPAEALAALPPPRVLLADDDDDLREFYSRLLQKRGWQVEVARHGVEALELALRARPDLVISDVMMPEMDGWGLLTHLRADYRLRETPVMMISCHGDYLEKLSSLLAGADGYFEKGMRGEVLLTSLEEILKPHRQLLAVARPGLSFGGALGRVGPQTLLETLSAASVTGTLRFQSGSGQHRVGLLEGRLTEASFQAGDVTVTGEKALLVTIALDEARFDFFADDPPERGALDAPFSALRERLATQLNAQRDRREDTSFLEGGALRCIHPERRDFYLTVAPQDAEEVARRLCEGTPPRLLLSEGASPMLVHGIARDLLRKRVAELPSPA